MPNLNGLIIGADQYEAALMIAGGGSYPVITLESLTWNETSEGETIYAIGSEDPIGEKSNANKYGGKIGMQNGEANAILKLEGLASMIRIRNAVLAITALSGGFAKTFIGVNINSANVDVKRKDKESIVNCDFNCVGIQ
jgi:hypothetical protein